MQVSPQDHFAIVFSISSFLNLSTSFLGVIDDLEAFSPHPPTFLLISLSPPKRRRNSLYIISSLFCLSLSFCLSHSLRLQLCFFCAVVDFVFWFLSIFRRSHLNLSIASLKSLSTLSVVSQRERDRKKEYWRDGCGCSHSQIIVLFELMVCA